LGNGKMNDKEVEAVISSEQEWRRYLVKKVDEIHKDSDDNYKTLSEKITNTKIEVSGEITDLKVEMGSLKVWSWISRSVIGSAFGLLIFWIRSKFPK